MGTWRAGPALGWGRRQAQQQIMMSEAPGCAIVSGPLQADAPAAGAFAWRLRSGPALQAAPWMPAAAQASCACRGVEWSGVEWMMRYRKDAARD